MAENHSSTRAPITRKPHRYQAEEDLVARFICHANSTHVLQSLWRGLWGELRVHRKTKQDTFELTSTIQEAIMS